MENNSPPTHSSWIYANVSSSRNLSLEASSSLLSSHGFPLVSPAVLHPKLNGSCCAKSSWPYTPHTKIYMRAGPTRCMPNTMKSQAGGPGERGRDYCKQLTGEQSTIPAGSLPSTAGNGWWTAFPLLTQPRLAPRRYLLMNKCSRAIHC